MEEHKEARFIVDTLANAGFVAYYAGGWVRDLILRHPSDDIDIATNAPPETIQALFPHTVPIGLAFGIILVIIDGKQYEVATFRQDLAYKDGRRPTKIAFATAIEDAKRRDFTINGMFFDPLKEEILDFVRGRDDLEKKLIRAIGNPHQRIHEDRLRMIRAVRLACRFHFTIEEETAKAIRAHAKELFPAVAIERIAQEFKKSHDFGHLRPMLICLHEFGLLQEIFPALKKISLEEISHRLSPTQYYPLEAPVIAFLLLLFPRSTLDEELQLCKFLKLSNVDLRFVSFLYHTKLLITISRPIERCEWAHFYAHAFSSLALQILSAPLEISKRTAFLKEHQEKRALLDRFIQRIQEENPIVTSDDLKSLGIKPGPQMGQLLREAERIAINEELYEPTQILERLQSLFLWPK